MSVSNVSSQKTIEEIIKSSKTSTSSRNTGALGKDDFLNLLVTQLRYQDPMNPQDDKTFIAQMAQFTALEQTQNMNATMTNTQAFSLIGKYINATTTDSSTNKTSAVEGVVSAVKISDGKSYVVVNNQDILLDRVTNVSESSSSSNTKNLTEYTSLLNTDVKAAVYDSKTGSIVPANGKVASLEKGQYEDYAVLDGVQFKVASVTKADGTVLASQSDIKSYLDSINAGTDKSVTISAVNTSNNNKVTVSADLLSYTVGSDGTVTTTLNGVYTPVESIGKIVKQV